MANTKEELKSVSFEDLAEKIEYKVLKSGFRKVDSKKGSFMSFWFVLKNEVTDEVFITSVTGHRADKCLATMNMRPVGIDPDKKCGINIKYISKKTSNNWADIILYIEPWVEKTDVPF